VRFEHHVGLRGTGGEIARNGDVIHEALVQGLIVNEPAVGYRLALPTPR